MPTFRSDLMSIPHYAPGRPIDEVARELGLTAIDKLASNECPTEPFPEVVAAIANAARQVNRYPDTSSHDVCHTLAEFHGVHPDAIWVGAGSSDIIRSVALALGGPDTSAVFADPSFVLYLINTLIAGAQPVRIPLDREFGHDLDAMLGAIRPDTTVVYVCNPNNPTGGHLVADRLVRFLDAVPESVLLVVDEAYAEYVTADDYASVLRLAPDRPNLLCLRTFSKVYGLAGLRIGFAVGAPEVIAAVRRTQAPFAVTTIAQTAALEALQHQDSVSERVIANAEGRDYLFDALQERSLAPAASQANFVYFEPQVPAASVAEDLTARGVIVRALGPGLRISVGTPAENERFVEALDAVMPIRTA
ncbi:MAG: histidinol-phosphate transaminase [Acidimicrobiia bacterium]